MVCMKCGERSGLEKEIEEESKKERLEERGVSRLERSMKQVLVDERRKEYKICFRCDENFFCEMDLMEHMVKVHTGKMCLECEVRYRSKEELKEHMKKAHEEDNILYVVDKEEYKEKIKNDRELEEYKKRIQERVKWSMKKK